MTHCTQLPPEAETTLAAYSSGNISAEIALMRLLLVLGDHAALFDFLEQRDDQGLRRTAAANREGLARTAALIRSGLARERSGSVAAIREQFDAAVTLTAEASVALYSLGSAGNLDRATAEIVDRLRDWSLLDPSVLALDIGCGIGRVEHALAPYVRSITGIDISPVMIDEARRRCAGLANVDFARCNGADLGDFAGREYDLILAVDSFPYLIAADPAIATRHIADAAGLLRQGGVLLILNYSYHGDLDADRNVLRRSASACGFTVERTGTRDFALWDGATFLLRKR